MWKDKILNTRRLKPIVLSLLQTGFYRRGKRHSKTMPMPVFPTLEFLEASKSLLITGSGYSGLNYLLELAEKLMRDVMNYEHALHIFSVGKMSR